MSGHSKWSKIKRKKAVNDSQRAGVFQKYSREIMVATKLGGSDSAANSRLRTAIEKAKEAGLPNDNIKRAIEKGAGGGDGKNYEELVYEGYAAGGVAVIVEVMTDNRNRSAGDIRSYFTKYGGNLSGTGSVSWMFEKKDGEFVCMPQYTIAVTDENTASQIIKLIDKLEEHDDVQNVYDNSDISDEIYEKIM
jgi:YebC/PmpR family DNA-binding regulatory protein